MIETDQSTTPCVFQRNSPGSFAKRGLLRQLRAPPEAPMVTDEHLHVLNIASVARGSTRR